ncbi:MAG: GNAT family N-acetyltransferase [bacterium]|nr:GNAT family N-acetyltransferase [bacterium]
MEIKYTTETPDKDQVFALFETTGWNEEYQLDIDELFEAISTSWFMVSAYDNGTLVGFGRMICDGIMHALILDMIVYPSYKYSGIGRTILNELVEKCKKHHIRDIQLFCAKGAIDFYKKHGFVERPDDAPGMQYKHQI